MHGSKSFGNGIGPHKNASRCSLVRRNWYNTPHWCSLCLEPWGLFAMHDTGERIHTVLEMAYDKIVRQKIYDAGSPFKIFL